MRVILKSNPNPSLKPEVCDAPYTAKPRKHHLQQLQNQVTKSRIAIQNMSHTRAIQGALYKKVTELQKDLHNCILSINHEQEKQKILEQLNHILKSEMSQVQAAQRTQDEFMCSSYQKKIKKVEYDIKQILHKYNEEIAKINWLKEQANSARDQRVVYSNLFNKIEKQIKHYEQLYRQNLIKNEIFLDQKRVISFKSNKNTLISPIDPVDQPTDQIIEFGQIQIRETLPTAISRKEVKPKPNKKSIDRSDKSAEQRDLFITNLKESISKQEPDKTWKDITSTSRRSVPQNNDVDSMICEKEAKIEAAIILTQCRSLEQVLQTYGPLQKQNQNMIGQISQIDQKISCLEQEIERQTKLKRTSEMYQNRHLNEIMNISKKSRSNKSIVIEAQNVKSQPLQYITIRICELLGVQCQNLGDDVFREIEKRIDELGCCTVVERRGRRDSRLISAQQMSSGDRGVCQLLEKIDKFGQSEKIFDRNMLRAEYHKQLNKVKKRGKKSS